MTTVVVERTAWDTFLIEDVERQVTLPEHREAALRSRRQHIEGFRATQWRSIKDQLKRQYHWVLFVEPHWVGPGSAVFWQKQTVRERGMIEDVEGKKRPAIIEVDKGWKATAPFSANNPSQIAYQLEKGLLLRHPDEGVCVEKSRPADPAQAAQDEDEVEPDQFFCDRHKGDRFGFVTWKAYCVHCVHWEEDIDRAQLPKDFNTGDHRWYCFVHRVGWKSNNARGALHHLVKHPRMDLAALEVDDGSQAIATQVPGSNEARRVMADVRHTQE
jgi:hypothetical protein